MNVPEMLDLPEAPCPKGGDDCCGVMYYGRRLCSYPQEVHLDMLLRVLTRYAEQREHVQAMRDLTDELDFALKPR